MINPAADATDEQMRRRRNFVAALRSGQYHQVAGTLTKLYPTTEEVVGHCCLGVACEQAIKDGLELKVTTAGEDRCRIYNGETTVLPDVVVNWYGFPSEDPEFLPGHGNAIAANDSEQLSFKQIADLFEAAYLPTDWAVTVAARG